MSLLSAVNQTICFGMVITVQSDIYLSLHQRSGLSCRVLLPAVFADAVFKVNTDIWMCCAANTPDQTDHLLKY